MLHCRTPSPKYRAAEVNYRDIMFKVKEMKIPFNVLT